MTALSNPVHCYCPSVTTREMPVHKLGSILFILSVVAAQQNVITFGAVAGVESLDQAVTNGKALASAVHAANAPSSTGADRIVLIPSNNTFWILPATNSTGFTYISNVTIQLDGTLSAYTTNFSSHWPVDPVTLNPADVLHFEVSTAVTITGAGLIEGNGHQWWWWVILGGYDNRPNLIGMNACAGCTVRGVTLKNSPQFHAYLMDMLSLIVEDVVVYVDVEAQQKMLAKAGQLLSNLTIRDDTQGPLASPALESVALAAGISSMELQSWTDWAANVGDNVPTFPINTDGIDVSGTSIIVRNVTITNYDDAVAIKPNNGGGRLSKCSQDIIVEDAHIHLGVGLTVGSVPPDSQVNCVRDVIFRNSVSNMPIKGIYLKTDPCFSGPATCGTGIIDNVTYANITMTRPLWWGIYAGPQQQTQPGNGTHAGCSFFFPLGNTTCPTQPRVPMTRLVFHNISVTNGLLSPGLLRCDPAGPCTGWEWDGVRVTNSSDWPLGDAFMCAAVSGSITGDNTPVPCINKTTILVQ